MANTTAAFLLCGMCASYGITPNKLVSGGLPAHTGATTTDYLTDGYLTNWKSSSAKEIALNVGEGPSKLLINWESFGDCAWATDFTSNCGHAGVALSSQKELSQNHGQVQFENLPMGQYIAIIRGRNMVQTSTVQVK